MDVSYGRGLKRVRSPSPSDGPPCDRCGRRRSTPNTIQCDKYKDDTLPFRGGTCIACINFTQKSWRSKPVAELAEYLKDPDNLDLYLERLAEYERDYVAAEKKKGRIPKTRSYLLSFKTVSAVEESKLMFEKDLGILWSEKLYKEKTGLKTIPKHLITQVQDEDGQMIKGVVLPSSEGSVPGCIAMKRMWSKGVRKDHEINNSVSGTDKEIDQDFKYAAAKIGKYEVEDKGTEQEPGLILKANSRASSIAGEDEGDDDINYLGGLMAHPPLREF